MSTFLMEVEDVLSDNVISSISPSMLSNIYQIIDTLPHRTGLEVYQVSAFMHMHRIALVNSVLHPRC